LAQKITAKEKRSMDSPQIATTLGDLAEAEPFLIRVSGHNGLSAKTKYHAAKLAKLVRAEAVLFHEQRAELFDRFSIERDAKSAQERDQHGSKVREVPAGAVKAFAEALKAVAVVPVVIPWGTLRSIDLPEAKASDLIGLGPLVELVEPPDEA
jgi:hypothetical protein